MLKCKYAEKREKEFGEKSLPVLRFEPPAAYI